MPVLLHGIWRAGFWVDNYFYAKRLFDDVVHYDRVLGSRRWFTTGIGCSYAIVELSVEAPFEPPAPKPVEDVKLDSSFYSFGGDWRPTPDPSLSDIFEQWYLCEEELGEQTYGSLRTAAAVSGGWWRRAEGGIFQVYSRPNGLAFILYEGD
ncbi:MAG: hypothetical protein DI533_18900 [Cereibacter sphaeroides]|uniref:Uncharacterized protein n=1 Tax=Cereibacter sphaeroides TaxID=1063 RepID=A0A2W5TY54_CERSP|nr:MAG: hypothetical protein DI533_18900 [Cereibacter sphaeroides]